jgi:aryl-alcohol dehydrogenase-like predicted oxidoreductase
METRQLGNLGLKVSTLSMGAMTFSGRAVSRRSATFRPMTSAASSIFASTPASI